MNFCPNCGTKTVTPDAQFCANCGFRMPADPMPQAEAPVAAVPDAAVPDAATPPATPPAEPLFRAAVGTDDLPAPAYPEAPEQAMPAAGADDLLSLIDARQESAAEPQPAAPDLFGGEAQYEAPAPAAQPAAQPSVPQPPAPQPMAEPVTPQPAASQPAPPDLFGGEAQFKTQYVAQYEPGAPAVQPAAQPAPQPPQQPAPPPAQQHFPQQQAARQVYSTASAGPSLFDGAASPPAAPDLFSSAQYDAAPRQPYAASQYDGDYAGGALPRQPQRPLTEREQYEQLARRHDRPEPPPKPAARRDRDKENKPAKRAGHLAEAPAYPGEEAAPAAAPRAKRPPPPQPPPLPLPEPEPRRRSVGGTILTFIVVVIIFAVLSGGTVMVMLYFQNRPATVVEKFTTAISEGDSAALEELVKLDGVNLDDESWGAFLAAFAKQTDVNILKAQLLQQAAHPETGVESTYPAVTIESRPFLLFIEKYTVVIKGVQLLAPGAEPGTIAQLNGKPYAGATSPEGEVYNSLMPGRYICQLAPPGTDPAGAAPIEIDMFVVDGPNRLSQGMTHADITVANCLTDDATLFVNDVPSDAKPSGGTVALPGVPVGSTIRIEAEQGGKTLTASVVFDSAANTSLSFGDYTDRDGDDPPAENPPASSSEEDSEALAAAKALSEGDIGTVLSTFYTSYLESINEQDIGRLKLATENAKNDMKTRISNDANKANRFEYTSAAAENSTITPKDESGTPAVTFTATFKYRYRPRDDEAAAWEDGSNRQDVKLVRKDGQWLVESLTRVE